MPAETRDDIGGVKRVWMSIGECWADVSPLQGKELFEAQAIEARINYKITLRGYTELDTRWRFVWLDQDKAFQISSIRDLHERHRTIECLVMEVQPTGRLGPDEGPSPSLSWM
jgi:SPP1 family predicted phage head-tail adaptor